MRRDVREFVQPYMEALRERMIMFGTDELDKLRTAMDNEFDDVTDPTTVFPEAPVRHQITSVTLSDEGLLGTSLAGAEIFEIPKSQLPETVTAATLIELAAGAMGVMPNSLTLWEGMSCSSCYVGYGFTTPNPAYWTFLKMYKNKFFLSRLDRRWVPKVAASWLVLLCLATVLQPCGKLLLTPFGQSCAGKATRQGA